MHFAGISIWERSDPTDVGGREKALVLKQNHQAAMLNSRPVVQSLIPPRPHISAQKQLSRASSATSAPQPQLKHTDQRKYDEFHFVNATFNTVFKNQKATVDSGLQDWKNKNVIHNINSAVKSERHQNEKHEKELKSLQQRMMRIGTSMHERKKNQSDPIAHPTLVFTKDIRAPEPKNYLLRQFLQPKKILSKELAIKTKKKDRNQVEKHEQLQKIEAQNVEGQVKKQELLKTSAREQQKKLPQKIEGQQQKTEKQSTSTAGVLENEKLLKYSEAKQQWVCNVEDERLKQYKETAMKSKANEEERDLGELLTRVPRAKGVTRKDYQSIHTGLVSLILDLNVLARDDIEIVFGNTVLINQHLRIDILDDIFKNITDTISQP